MAYRFICHPGMLFKSEFWVSGWALEGTPSGSYSSAELTHCCITSFYSVCLHLSSLKAFRCCFVCYCPLFFPHYPKRLLFKEYSHAHTYNLHSGETWSEVCLDNLIYTLGLRFKSLVRMLLGACLGCGKKSAYICVWVLFEWWKVRATQRKTKEEYEITWGIRRSFKLQI